VVERTCCGHATGYALTEMGRELGDFCFALGEWGARWREVAADDQNPYLALWTLSRLIDPVSLPRPRVVVRFDVQRSRTPRHFWLLLDRLGNEVCAETPGFADDGLVTTDVGALVRWCAGQLDLPGARDAGQMTVTAPPWLERELARWGRLNPYAGIERGRTSPPVP
jgi:hypothetical protein